MDHFLAVAPHRHFKSVKDDSTPYIGVYEVLSLRDALEREWKTDAHCVTYRQTSKGVGDRQARIKKDGVAYARERFGVELVTSVLMLDVDNPGHADWTPALYDEAMRQYRELPIFATCGVYHTAHGRRFVQPLPAAVATSEVEAWIAGWLNEAREQGIEADEACRDWTRHFRMPHVARNGRRVARAPFVDFSRMSERWVPKGEWKKRASVQTAAEVERVREQRAARDPVAKPPVTTLAANLAGHAEFLGEAIRGTRLVGQYHAMYLALAGALLEAGVAPEQVPALVRKAGDKAGHTDTWKHEASAVDTLEKFRDGHRVTGRGDLLQLSPTVDEALQLLVEGREHATGGDDDPKVAAEKMRDVLRGAGYGLRVLSAECGLGKTAAAIDVACERAERGSKTAISAPTNALAMQIARDVAAKGASVKRVFGPLSVEGPGGCIHRARALPLVNGGQNLRRLFCEPKRGRCEAYDTCTVRDGYEGPSDARVIVGNHALLGTIRGELGTSGLLIVDEPPGLLQADTITPGRSDIAKRESSAFVHGYVEPMGAVLDLVWGSASEVSEPLGSDLAAMVTFENEKWEVPPIRRSRLDYLLSQFEGTKLVGDASRVWKQLWDAVHSDEPVFYRKYGEDLVFTNEHRKLKEAINHSGGCVVLDANARTNVALYERVIGGPLVKGSTMWSFAARDGTAIDREQVIMGRTSRSGMTPNGRIQWDTVGRMLSEVRAWMDRGWGGIYGFVSYPSIEQAVRAACGMAETMPWKEAWGDKREAVSKWAPILAGYEGRIVTMHYGYVRGFNSMATCEGIVTLGDYWPNLTKVEDEIALTGGAAWTVDDRMIGLARDEEEQAHGRLRVVHRGTRGRCLHVGKVKPGGWGWTRGEVVVRAVEGSI